MSDQFPQEEDLPLVDQLDEILGQIVSEDDLVSTSSWMVARSLTSQLTKIPWFVRRIVTVGLGPEQRVTEVPQGLFFGFKKLALAASADSLIGDGKGASDLRRVFTTVDVTALCGVVAIHAINKKFTGGSPLLEQLIDDALFGGQIGFILGSEISTLGPGRGLIAGYILRIGVPILMKVGSEDQSQKLQDALVNGNLPFDAANSIYNCSPLQCASLLLGTIGCGLHACLGLIDFYQGNHLGPKDSRARELWGRSFYLIDQMLKGRHNALNDPIWEELNFDERSARLAIVDAIDDFASNPSPTRWML